MKHLHLLFLLLTTCIANAQNEIEWSKDYKLQLSDFQSPATEINGGTIYSLGQSADVRFSFSMTSAEFIFTKNFNSKVNCSFSRSAASLVAPDTMTAMSMLNFARFSFDLAELYARKVRKKLYEEKNAFSNITFFKPVFDQIESEHEQRRSQAAKDTDVGRNVEVLKFLQGSVVVEIDSLADFCKTCKPQKKKK